MANQFVRFPVVGGDNDVWPTYVDPQLRSAGIGAYTSYLYDDSGTLKVATGKIGIDDGVNEGTCEIDTITTISIAGVTNDIWAKVEVAVSGTTVTFTALDIVGATDSTVIPNDFSSNYNGEKGGFYISANKRTIGLIWKTSGGVLDGVLNSIGNQNGYVGASETSDFRLSQNHTILDLISQKGVYLGVDVIDPDEKLVVDGGFKVTSNIAGAYQANSILIDNSAGNTRFFSCGSDGSTKGSFQFSGTASDGNPNTQHMTLSSSGELDIKIGDVIVTAGTVQAALGITVAYTAGFAAATTQGFAFAALAPFVPNIGDKRIASGTRNATDSVYAVERSTATLILIYFAQNLGAVCNSGDGTALGFDFDFVI